jgi:hypothetical protein
MEIDRVFTLCVESLQHLYLQVSILENKCEDTDEFTEIYEAASIILRSKINITNEEIVNFNPNIILMDSEDAYYHLVKSVSLMFLFIHDGLIKFDKKVMLPFRPIFNMFFQTFEKCTNKKLIDITDELEKSGYEIISEPEDMCLKMKTNVKI